MEPATRQSGTMPIIALIVLCVLGLSIISIVISSIVQRKGKYTPNSTEGSCFDGNFWSWLGWRFLSGMLSSITLGIAYPWAKCMMLRWEVGHTVVNGRRLRFIGSGGQLFGKYILWALLTIVTCGVFGIWMNLRMKKWVTKYTVYADEVIPRTSRFTGNIGGYFGIRILAGLLTVCTLGIGAAWAERMILNWEIKHTYISGTRLGFAGKGGQLFGKYILWGFLSIITLSIYSWFVPIRYRKWVWSHVGAEGCSVPEEKKTPAWGVILIVLAVVAILAGTVAAVVYFMPQIAPMVQNLFR